VSASKSGPTELTPTPNGGLAVGSRRSGLSFGIMRLIDDGSECNFLESLQGPYKANDKARTQT
jgi:hypothetical protein